MSKLLDSSTIKGIIPKMVETSNEFIINSQVYDKDTLDPKKFNNLYIQSATNDIFMNIHAKVNVNNHSKYYTKDCIITDKYDPNYSFTMFCDTNGLFRVFKFINKNNKLEIYKELTATYSFLYFEIYSQDVNYIYAYSCNKEYENNIFKVNKETLQITSVNIVSKYSNLTLLKDTPLYIYYSYSKGADNFYIGRYNKSDNSKTDIYNDNGLGEKTCWSVFSCMQLNETEIISLRTARSFNNLSIDKLLLKKYIIDYDFEKVYYKNLELDCSLIPDKYIPRIDSTTYFTQCHYFTIKNKEYFIFWNKGDKKLYLASKTSENVYTITQIYEFANSYYGLIVYNDKTLILYNSNSIDFLSFRTLEEKFELSTSLKGGFTSIGIDKSQCIWVQNIEGSVDIVGLNVPTIAEALFIDQQLNYENSDIETFVEVFCKNFNGDLLVANLEIFLNGPIVFSDTKSKKRIVKTSSNNTIRIPVTITNSGIIETNIKIL